MNPTPPPPEILERQVTVDHYAFDSYMTKNRWASIWHQLDEVIRLQYTPPPRVLEVGPGAGLFQKIAGIYGVPVETLDLDPELKPDHVASVTEMPFPDGAFDIVCAFQMLEHIPYEMSLRAFAEMARVAKRAVIISLPDAQPMLRFAAYIPRLGVRQWMFPRPFHKPLPHKFDGEHYWEINKDGYPFSRIEKDFSEIRPLKRWYRVPENPYHRFMIFD